MYIILGTLIKSHPWWLEISPTCIYNTCACITYVSVDLAIPNYVHYVCMFGGQCFYLAMQCGDGCSAWGRNRGKGKDTSQTWFPCVHGAWELSTYHLVCYHWSIIVITIISSYYFTCPINCLLNLYYAKPEVNIQEWLVNIMEVETTQQEWAQKPYSFVSYQE